MSMNKLEKCFKEGMSNEERHKGLRRIKPSKKLAVEHLAKSIHNFEAITAFHDIGYSDWSASAAFYALYQGLLAILAQKGFESRNQSCTFALLEEWIKKGEVKGLTIKDVKDIFDQDVTEYLEQSKKILDIREIMQYGTKTALVEAEFQLLKKKTKELFDKMRLELESIEE